MNERIERVNALVSGLRLTSVDLEQLYAEKNQLTPLESVEIFLSEQQRLRTEKQNLIRRKRANLPAEKTLETFDFGLAMYSALITCFINIIVLLLFSPFIIISTLIVINNKISDKFRHNSL